MKEYYLASLESRLLDYPRKCAFEREVQFDTGKNAVIAKLDPSIQLHDGVKYYLVEKVVLTARFEGDDISCFSKFPFFVYVAEFQGDIDEIGEDDISKDDLKIIGLGELYRNEEDAKEHRFDRTEEPSPDEAAKKTSGIFGRMKAMFGKKTE